MTKTPTEKTESMRDKIMRELANSSQVTGSDYYTRSKEYKGYYLSDDDAPLFTYNHFREIGTKSELKDEIISLRNEGLIELVNAVDEYYKPNGSGWSLTELGLKYVVDNNLIDL